MGSQNNMFKTKLFIVIFSVIIASTISASIFVNLSKEGSGIKISSTSPTVSLNQMSNFTYQGQNGKDALTLLREKTSVGLNSSGMVSSINNRVADAAKHEYWAFYVNEKMAQVGPAQYISKSSDVLQWKIEKY